MSATADTNVLVRLFTHDNASQRRKATELLELLEETDASLFVPQIVLCELVWVLTRSYRFDRARRGSRHHALRDARHRNRRRR